MKQYIDKAAVVAEIERRIKKIDEIGTYLSPKGVLTNLLCHLDTLEVKEVKEVNLDMEINLWVRNLHRVPNFEELNKFANHFFELGIKAQKGE